VRCLLAGCDTLRGGGGECEGAAAATFQMRYLLLSGVRGRGRPPRGEVQGQTTLQLRGELRCRGIARA